MCNLVRFLYIINLNSCTQAEKQWDLRGSSRYREEKTRFKWINLVGIPGGGS